MRVQFPDPYEAGQEVATASGAVTLDADRTADLTEAAYLALQWDGVAVRMATSTQGRDNARAQIAAQRQAVELHGAPDGPVGKAKWHTVAKAER